MGTVPIVIFRGLRQSRPQGHGELGPPHFPGYTNNKQQTPAWCNPRMKHLYIYISLSAANAVITAR